MPTEIAVFSVGPANPNPEIPQDAQPWPLATPPAPVGDQGARPCLPISGPDTPELLAALERANQATPWTVEGVAEPLSLVFRPLLPGDAPCGPVDDSGCPSSLTPMTVICEPTTTIAATTAS